VVVGGGGRADNTNFVMVASYYNGDSSWWATFKNLATTNQTVVVTAFAICTASD
jgi:hypothetical protein